MKSKLPKTLHLLEGEPMVSYVVSELAELHNKSANFSLDELIAVVGVKAKKVSKAISQKVSVNTLKVGFVKQKVQLGTGDAVKQALLYIGDKQNISEKYNPVLLVLPADVPNITFKTLEELINTHLGSNNVATILTTKLDDPTGYGRIVYKSNDAYESENLEILKDSREKIIKKIIEQKDATVEELKLNEINTSIYCFNFNELKQALEKVQPLNALKEYYLTDVVKILLEAGHRVATFFTANSNEVIGVNTPAEFERASEIQRMVKS